MVDTTTTTTTAEASFRGWQIVGAAFSVLFVVYGIQFSFGTFVNDIVDDTGWPKSRLQLAYALYILTYSALSAVSGHLTDRYGPRRVVATGAVLLTAGYLLWAFAPNLWVAFVGLGVIAPLGMSASWVPCNATVVRWFVQRRGTALAITAAGGSLANIVAPPMAATLVENFGWRSALASFAVAGGIVMLISSVWFRRDPESVGEFPDGIDSSAATTGSAVDDDVNMTPAQAIRTRTYWLILSMYGLSFVVIFVPVAHINQFAQDLGVTEVRAATVISAIGVGGLLGRLCVGPISDRWGRRRLVVAAFSLETVAFIGIALADGLPLLYLAATAFGFAYGAGVTLLPAMVGDYFGRAYAGSIVGRIFATAGSLAAIGPFVAQLMVDSSGSYRVAFLLSAGLNAAALTMATQLPARARPG